MVYVREFCALIMSGFTLYNGLEIEKGIVAVYAKDLYAHSLIKYGTVDSNEALQAMLLKNSELKLKLTPHRLGPVDLTVCVARSAGVNSLEEYLIGLGFKRSLYEHEQIATQQYLDKHKYIPSGTITYEEEIMNESTNKGKLIAAAITEGYVSLFGRFGCASSTRNYVLYQLEMNSPLDMGIITFKSMISYSGVKKGLVYINGHLRILSCKDKLIEPYNEVIWDIYPKLDYTGSQGVINRKLLDSYLLYNYDHPDTQVEHFTQERVLLGCYDSRK